MAFAHLVRRHQGGVHRFIMRMLGSHEEALELTQETFIKAWHALPRWQPQAQFKTWIYRIASNTAMDALRRRKIVEMVPLEDTVGDSEFQPLVLLLAYFYRLNDTFFTYPQSLIQSSCNYVCF